MLKVFLSYARSDGAQAAARLRYELERAKVQVWRDAEDLRGGEDWREQLRAALREVDVVMVMLTPSAVASPYVATEWENALALEKHVVPVLTLPCEVPAALNRLHYRNLGQVENYTLEVIGLINDLKIVWTDIRDSLSALLADPSFSDFYPLVDTLERMVNAEHSPPEVIRAFIFLIRQMNADRRHNCSIRELAGQTITGDYVQSTWPMHRVFVENELIFRALLTEFCTKLKPEDSTPVPIVLVVMNDEEAEELACFDPLSEFLDSSNVQNWTKRYHTNPEEWQPFGSDGSGESIEEIVGHVLESVASPGQVLVPSFKDIRTLVDPRNRRLLKHLRHQGCVVVIDSISIYHPVLQRTLQQSGLDSSAGTSVVTISPTQGFKELVREMTIVFSFSILDTEFNKRCFDDDDEDYGVCEEILDPKKFRKWLVDRITKMANLKAAMQGNIRDFMWK